MSSTIQSLTSQRTESPKKTNRSQAPARAQAPQAKKPEQTRDRVSVSADSPQAERPRSERNGLMSGLAATYASPDSIDRPRPTPSTNPDEPAAIETGTLDYYEQRAQDYERRHPGEEAPDYYREYGDKYVNRFEELKDELSPAGDRFVDETRQNLQDALEELRQEDPEAFARLEEDPEALRDFAFETHSQAYLDGGLADLPASDLLTIATTPDLQDTLTPEGLSEFAETIVPVLSEHPELLLEVPAEVLQRLPGAVIEGLADVGGAIADRLGDLFSWLPDIDLPNPLGIFG